MKPVRALPLFLFLLAGMSSCTKWNLGEKDFPEIATTQATLTSTTSVLLKGEISGLKKGDAEDHGFVWSSETDQPSLVQFLGITRKGSRGDGEFESNVIDLERNKVYYVRAYVEYDDKVYYGEALSFQTGDLILTTDEIIYDRGKSMKAQGTITGLDPGVGANQYGHCWSTSNPAPSISSDPFSNLGKPNLEGKFISEIDSLENNQTYFVRSYVLINFGSDTLYGNTLTYTTSLGDVWDAAPNFPQSVARGGAFVLKGKAYALGNNQTLWRFEPSTGGWSQMADYPGGQFEAGATFVIGDTAYVGLGNLNTSSPSFYKYTDQNQWTQVQDPFPGQTRTRGVSFSMGDKGYVGMGFKDYGAGYINLQEIFVYNSQNGQWNPSPIIFPGGPKNAPMFFTLENLVYFVGGAVTKDVYTFAPATGDWQKKKDFPGGNVELGIGFSIGQTGYVGMGFQGGYSWSNKLWEYDQSKDSWIVKASLPGAPRRFPMGFALDGKGYVLCGEGFSSNLNDVWVYTPD
jgi:N-acetylneuraminic acid mutarotase